MGKKKKFNGYWPTAEEVLRKIKDAPLRVAGAYLRFICYAKIQSQEGYICENIVYWKDMFNIAENNELLELFERFEIFHMCDVEYNDNGTITVIEPNMQKEWQKVFLERERVREKMKEIRRRKKGPKTKDVTSSVTGAQAVENKSKKPKLRKKLRVYKEEIRYKTKKSYLLAKNYGYIAKLRKDGLRSDMKATKTYANELFADDFIDFALDQYFKLKNREYPGKIHTVTFEKISDLMFHVGKGELMCRWEKYLKIVDHKAIDDEYRFEYFLKIHENLKSEDFEDKNNDGIENLENELRESV